MTHSTWDNVVEMRRCITLMRMGNPYFAWQYTFVNIKGEKDQGYRPCHRVAELDNYEQAIFDGKRACGFYTIRPDNFTRWGAIDFDDHDGSKPRDYWRLPAQGAFDSLASQLAEAWLIATTRGGFHVIGFDLELRPAAVIREMLRPFAPEGVEVFPKQDQLDATKPNAKGNLLRFPGRHQLKGSWSKFLDRRGRIENVEVPAPEHPPVFSVPDEQMRFLALYHNVTRGLTLTGSGQRYRTMQRIVGRLKGRTLDEDVAALIHDRFYNANRQHIGTSIVESRRQFMVWFRNAKPCVVTLPDYEPTDHQQRMILEMREVPGVRRDRLETAVRLFLSAYRHAQSQNRECFMSLRTLADRLQVSIAAASKYRNACYRIGLIEMVKLGSQASGLASTYAFRKEWLK